MKLIKVLAFASFFTTILYGEDQFQHFFFTEISIQQFSSQTIISRLPLEFLPGYKVRYLSDENLCMDLSLGIGFYAFQFLPIANSYKIGLSCSYWFPKRTIDEPFIFDTGFSLDYRGFEFWTPNLFYQLLTLRPKLGICFDFPNVDYLFYINYEPSILQLRNWSTINSDLPHYELMQ